MLISFAFTSPALVAGAKTMTRRDWSPEYAARFHAGALVDAWDRSPRTRLGRKVATIRITRDPWQQRTGVMNSTDYVREGIAWLAEHGHRPPAGDGWAEWWSAWTRANEMLWVVEFDLIEVVR